MTDSHNTRFHSHFRSAGSHSRRNGNGSRSRIWLSVMAPPAHGRRWPPPAPDVSRTIQVWSHQRVQPLRQLRVGLAGAVAVIAAAGAIAGTEPVLEYTFDEGDREIARDSSGSGLHGRIHGARLVRQATGYALLLDGVDDCVEVPQSAAVDELGKPGRSYSIELWFTARGRKYQSLTEKWLGNPYPWALRGPDETGLLEFALYDGKRAAIAQVRDAAFLDNEWHHAVGVRDTEKHVVQLYVDGELRSQARDSLGDVSNRGPFAIGRRNAPSSGKRLYEEYCFRGRLDGFRLYRGALTGADVSARFEADAHGKGIVREITAVRDVRRAVDLSGSERPLVIVPPADPDYTPVARTLAAELKARLGATPEIAGGDAQVFPEACNLIVIGNVNTGALFARLYFNYYTYANSLYPGEGGFVLRTVFEPYPWYGKGDVIVIGCSDAEGAARGAAALLQHVSVSSRSLAHTLVVSATRPLAELQRSVGYGFHVMSPLHSLSNPDAMPPTFESFDALARQYFKSGDERRARRAVDVLERICRRYASHRGPVRDLRDAGYGGAFLAVWDAFEEYPSLTDEQRLRFTRALLTQYRAQVEEAKAYDWGKIGHNDLLTWNHTTFPLLGVYYGARYFWNHYGLTEARTGLRKARQCFLAQARSWKPEEDADIYIGHTMEHTQAYLLGEWALDFFTTGVNQAYTDYYVGICDSAGLNGGFGDSSYGRNPSLALCALPLSFWHTRDARYLWIIRHYLGDRWQNPFHRDVVPVPDASHVGMRVFAMDPQLYRHTQTRSFYGEPVSPPNVPLEAAFDKVAFRESWSRDAQYLLLDGFSRGKHLHYDGNAINVFVDRGRRWLIDHDYLVRNTTEHNMITVVRDGRVTRLEPSCAGIVCAGQGRDLAMLTTEVRGYEDADWQRSIFWLKGDCFVCMERVVAREPGEYAVDLTWKLEDLGTERCVGARAFCAVRPEFSAVSRDVYVVPDESASGGAAVVFPKSGSVWGLAVTLPAGNYGLRLVGYGLDGSSDSLYGAAQGMAQAEFHLPKSEYGFSTSEYGKANSATTVRFEESGRHMLRFWMRECPPVRVDRIVFADEHGEPVLEVEAEEATPAGHDESGGGQADRFWLKWAEPVTTRVERYTTRGISVALCKLWQRTAGRLEQHDALEIANVFYTDSTTAPLTLDLHRAGPRAVLLKGDRTALFAVRPVAIGELVSDAGMLCLSPERVAWADGSFVEIGGDRFPAAGKRYTEQRLTGNARGAAARLLEALAPRPGRGEARRPEAAEIPRALPRWTFDTGRSVGVNRMRTADLDGDGRSEILIAAGTGASALTADGRLLWSFRLNGLCYDVRAGEGLDEYPGQEVVVAGGDCFLYLLDSKGRLLRKTEMRDAPRGSDHGSARFEVLTAAILNTDGVARVFAANSRFDVVTLDMQLNRTARAVYSAQHGGIDLRALDVSGDGRKEVFCTDHYGHLHVLAHDGEKIRGYYTSIGDMVADFGDLNGDGLVEAVFGSSTGDVMCATFTHAQPWKGQYKDPWWWRNVGYPVNRIRVGDLDGDGSGEVAIASGTGYLYVLDARGNEKWRQRSHTNVADVIVLGGDRPRLAYIDSAGTITTTDGHGRDKHVRRLDGTPRSLIACGDLLVVPLESEIVAVPMR